MKAMGGQTATGPGALSDVLATQAFPFKAKWWTKYVPDERWPKALDDLGPFEQRAGYQRITRMAHQAYADAVLLPGTPARWELGRALETPLYAVALAAVDLLTEVDLRTVRQCSVAGCSALAVEDARHRCAEELGGRAGVADRQAYATVARAIA